MSEPGLGGWGGRDTSAMPLLVQQETHIFWLFGCSWGTGSEEQPVGTLLSALHSGLVIPLQQRPQRVLGLPPGHHLSPAQSPPTTLQGLV